MAEMPVGLMNLRCGARWGIPSLPCGAGPSPSWGLSLGVFWANGLGPRVGVSPDVGRAWRSWGETGPCSSRGPFLLSGMGTLFSLAQWLAA